MAEIIQTFSKKIRMNDEGLRSSQVDSEESRIELTFEESPEPQETYIRFAVNGHWGTTKGVRKFDLRLLSER